VYKNGDKYSGNFENNHEIGYGEFENHQGSIFFGTFPSGFGLWKILDGDEQIGYFRNRIAYGYGQLIQPKFIYKGNFINDELHGFGELIIPGGENFIGYFEGSQKNGFG
jgi:hypothetical protein